MTRKVSTRRVQWYNVTVKSNDNPMIDENPEAEVEAVEEASQEKEAEETV